MTNHLRIYKGFFDDFFWFKYLKRWIAFKWKFKKILSWCDLMEVFLDELFLLIFLQSFLISFIDESMMIKMMMNQWWCIKMKIIDVLVTSIIYLVYRRSLYTLKPNGL